MLCSIFYIVFNNSPIILGENLNLIIGAEAVIVEPVGIKKLLFGKFFIDDVESKVLFNNLVVY